MLKELQKKLQKKIAATTAYSKYSETARIGMNIPKEYIQLKEGVSLDIKLAPPKFPKNPDKSKKVYKGIFIRSQKPFKALYDIETGIYICSLFNDRDERVWIDENYNKIKERIQWTKEY